MHIISFCTGFIYMYKRIMMQSEDFYVDHYSFEIRLGTTQCFIFICLDSFAHMNTLSFTIIIIYHWYHWFYYLLSTINVVRSTRCKHVFKGVLVFMVGFYRFGFQMNDVIKIGNGKEHFSMMIIILLFSSIEEIEFLRPFINAIKFIGLVNWSCGWIITDDKLYQM